jgi:hypothetical protein
MERRLTFVQAAIFSRFVMAILRDNRVGLPITSSFHEHVFRSRIPEGKINGMIQGDDSQGGSIDYFLQNLVLFRRYPPPDVGR